MDTDNLIHTLVTEGAQKPMTDMRVQLAAWMSGTTIWLAAILAFKGIRPDFLMKLHQPLYTAEFGLLICAGFSAAAAALALARPDAYQLPRLRLIPLVMIALWAVTAYLDIDPVTPSALTLAMQERHFDCIACIVIFCIPPGIIMAFLIRHGAPVCCGWAGGMTAGSLTAFAYLIMRIAEPTDNPFHLLIWHGMPVLILCVAGIVAGRIWLRWAVPVKLPSN